MSTRPYLLHLRDRYNESPVSAVETPTPLWVPLYMWMSSKRGIANPWQGQLTELFLWMRPLDIPKPAPVQLELIPWVYISSSMRHAAAIVGTDARVIYYTINRDVMHRLKEYQI